MLLQLWKNKAFRFLVCGGIAAIFNVLLLVAIIRAFQIETPLLRNLANVFSIEVSLVLSFFLYRAWVWSVEDSSIQDLLLRQVPLYHLSVATTIVSRSFIIFPILDWLGIHYVLNTLVGILIGSLITYKISDKWIFKK